MLDRAGPWGTGPYRIVEGFSLPEQRTDRVILEAYTDYWDHHRLPRLQRIVFDNTLSQKEALDLVKSHEGRVDLVTGLNPLETLRVAQSSFAKVVKNRGSLGTAIGLFNMQKVHSPWRDVRLRQAVNYAINRPDLIRYATKGNGVVIPTLIPAQGFGYDPELMPYPFDPVRTQRLLRDAGYPNGLPLTLLAPEDMAIQATVVSKMLEHAGFQVERQVLDLRTYNQRVHHGHLNQPPKHQAWDIALTSSLPDVVDFPVYFFYHVLALGGYYDWVDEQPELRKLYQQVLSTVDRMHQQDIIHQMERHTHEQAYFLFLYKPIQLYAVNKAVEFVPHVTTILSLAETSVTDRHWSVRKQKAAVHK